MTAFRQYLALSRRSILDTARQPAAVIPAFVFPLMFLALSAGAFGQTTRLPGFPKVESFLQFFFATTVIQGALFGSIAAGSDMATDIEHGFFDRLVASPVARTSILVGRLAGAALLGFVQAWFFIGVASLFGLTIAGGFLAMLLLSLIAALVSAGIGAIAVTLALRTGSTEAVQGTFPLLFVMLFFSSAFFPLTLMEGWFKAVATYNPISKLIEGSRALVIEGVQAVDLLWAFGVAAGILVLGTMLAGVALRRRLAAA